MDFNYKKPLHLFALFLIFLSVSFLIILPVLSYGGYIGNLQDSETTESLGMISEILLLFFQLAMSIVLLVLFPIIWYYLVNNLSAKEALSKMKLKLENIDIAFMWGISTAVLIFVIFFIVNIFIALFFNLDSENLSNVEDLEALFSPVSLFILVATQPIAEEIFFRGFLLDKIDSYAGQNIAIVSTAILFGLAHASYGKLYPIILPMIMGILLGYIVVRTKNLTTAIIAHVCFNVGVLFLAFLAGTLG